MASLRSAANGRYYRRCDKCGMQGLKAEPGIQVQGIKRYMIYKCIYCKNVVKREV